MPRIKMTSTQRASTNGIHIEEFEEGVEYDVGERIYDIFVNQLEVALKVSDEELNESENSIQPSNEIEVPEIRKIETLETVKPKKVTKKAETENNPWAKK